MKLKIKSNIDFRYAGGVSAVVFIFGLVLSTFLIPTIVNYFVKKMTVLTPASLFRKNQDKSLYMIKFYLFNITNFDEVPFGAIPKLQEIGPYVYEYHQFRINQVDDEEADTFTYDLRSLYYYRPDLSPPDTANQIFCTISALMVSGLTKVIIETPELISFVKDGIDLINGRPDTPMICVPPLQVIHEGYDINCDQKEFTAKAICSALAAQDYIKRVNGSEKHLQLAALFKLNDTIQARFTIRRGRKNVKDVGKIIAINGEPILDLYDDDKCNIINGTDSVTFAPKQKKEEAQWIYAHDACRSFPLEYIGKKRIHGIKAIVRELMWNSSLLDPDCNANEYLGRGYSGSSDMHDCVEAFSYLVGPHNYLADPLLSENLEGLVIDKKKHATEFYLDPLTGARLLSNLRFQVNVLVKPIESYGPMKNLLEFALPYNWCEFKYELPSNVTQRVKILHMGKTIANFIGHFILFIGVIGCVGSLIAIAMNIGPETPKILNVVPNSGDVSRPEKSAESASTRTY